MKRMLIITAIILALVALFSCKKDGNIEAPTTLEGSTWCSTINPDTFEQTRVEFTSLGEATYSVIIRGLGTDKTIQTAEYTYSYNRPYITLTPKSDNTPALKGYIKTLGEAYNILQLESEDGQISIQLTQLPDKSDTVWQ